MEMQELLNQLRGYGMVSTTFNQPACLRAQPAGAVRLLTTGFISFYAATNCRVGDISAVKSRAGLCISWMNSDVCIPDRSKGRPASHHLNSFRQDYNTRATGISLQRVVHAGESISRFIFHSVLTP